MKLIVSALRAIVAVALVARGWASLRGDASEEAAWEAAHVTTGTKFGGGNFGAVYSWPLAVKVLDLRNGNDVLTVPDVGKKHALLVWRSKNEAKIHKEIAGKAGAECFPHVMGLIDFWCEKELPGTFFAADSRDTSPDLATKAKLQAKKAQRIAAMKAKMQVEIDNVIAAKGLKLCKEIYVLDDAPMYFDPTSKSVHLVENDSGNVKVVSLDRYEYRPPDSCVFKSTYKSVYNTFDGAFSTGATTSYTNFIPPGPKPLSAGVNTAKPTGNYIIPGGSSNGASAVSVGMTSPLAGAPAPQQSLPSGYIALKFRDAEDSLSAQESGDAGALEVGVDASGRVSFDSPEDAVESAAVLPHFGALLSAGAFGEEMTVGEDGKPVRGTKVAALTKKFEQGTLEPGGGARRPTKSASSEECNYRLILTEAAPTRAAKVVGKDNNSVVSWLKGMAATFAEEKALDKLDEAGAAATATFLRLFWFMQIVFSDRWLHNHGVDHRDLNQGNILVAENWRCAAPRATVATAACAAGVCYTLGPDTYCFTPSSKGAIRFLLRFSLRIVDFGIAWSRGDKSMPRDLKWSTERTKGAIDALLGVNCGIYRSWPDAPNDQEMIKNDWNSQTHGQLTDVAVSFGIPDWKRVIAPPQPESADYLKDFNAIFSFERSPAFVDVIRSMFAAYHLKKSENPPPGVCHYSTV